MSIVGSIFLGLLDRGWNNVEKLHWCYTQTEWHTRKLYAIISAVAWPLKAVFFAVKRTMQWGPRVKKETGIPETRQFLDQLYLAIRYFIPPRAFYFYRLYDSTNYELASQYIHHHEICALMWFIISSKDRNILDDKRRFSQKCEVAGLPTVPIIAEFEGGGIKRWANGNNKELPKTDLFAKPAGGIQGLGVKLYPYQGRDRYRKDDGILLTHDELLDHLSECSRVEAYILQKRLFNHPDISGLSTGALCTVRVVTCRLPGNPARPLISIFKMPTGMHPTDNFRGGGLASPVEESSGILGSAVSKNLDGYGITRHPDTGQKIVGVKIPFWPQIIELSLQAHETFSSFSSVGWDVAVTEDGPLLVEGNPVWGIESLQRAHDRPLGGSCFPETFLSDFSRHKHFTPALRSHLLPNL